MKKKRLFASLVFVLVLFLSSTGMCRPPYYSHHYSHRYPHHNYHHHYYGHGGDALAWGLTGLVVGSLITGIIMQPPPVRHQVVYSPPPPPPASAQYYGTVYSYPPQVPPGMCRWERYILDSYGRHVIGPDGLPAKQYTLGSCQYPPR